MNIIFLDSATVDLGDINLSQLKKIGSYQSYQHTKTSQIYSRCKNAEIIITNKIIFDEKILSKLNQLKLICVTATGTNNIDLDYCKKNKIQVRNVAGYSTDTVAEHAMMFLLNFSHRFQSHQNAAINGEWSQSPHFSWLKAPFSDLKGKTLGVIGYGNIGKRVAKLAKAFGMKVLISKIPGRTYAKSSNRISLNQVLKQSDFISLHCPLTEKTKYLIHSKNLKLMKSSAYLLNLARGPIVNEKDIAQALKKKIIAGYATDVTEVEPINKLSPLLNKSIRDQVMITPHIAWASQDSRQRLMDEVIKNIDFFIRKRNRNRVA